MATRSKPLGMRSLWENQQLKQQLDLNRIEARVPLGRLHRQQQMGFMADGKQRFSRDHSPFDGYPRTFARASEEKKLEGAS